MANFDELFEDFADVKPTGKTPYLEGGSHKCKLVGVDTSPSPKHPGSDPIRYDVEIVASSCLETGSRWRIHTDQRVAQSKDNRSKILKQLLCALQGIKATDPRVNFSSKKDPAAAKKLGAQMKTFWEKVQENPSLTTKAAPHGYFRVEGIESWGKNKEGEPTIYTNYDIEPCEESWMPTKGQQGKVSRGNQPAPAAPQSQPKPAPTEAVTDGEAVGPEEDFGFDF